MWCSPIRPSSMLQSRFLRVMHMCLAGCSASRSPLALPGRRAQCSPTSALRASTSHCQLSCEVECSIFVVTQVRSSLASSSPTSLPRHPAHWWAGCYLWRSRTRVQCSPASPSSTCSPSQMHRCPAFACTARAPFSSAIPTSLAALPVLAHLVEAVRTFRTVSCAWTMLQCSATTERRLAARSTSTAGPPSTHCHLILALGCPPRCARCTARHVQARLAYPRIQIAHRTEPVAVGSLMAARIRTAHRPCLPNHAIGRRTLSS
mmetsp:Transcript_63404/g.125383  ORF Transcript_63404/g.125383 Transcript_63404/m.125383 type:complete len:262 (+) Transcript_63404:1827-2612(+)